MIAEDFFSILEETDQATDFLGLKSEKTENCINCNTELVRKEDNILFCPNCRCIIEHNSKRFTGKKILSLNNNTKVNNVNIK